MPQYRGRRAAATPAAAPSPSLSTPPTAGPVVTVRGYGVHVSADAMQSLAAAVERVDRAASGQPRGERERSVSDIVRATRVSVRQARADIGRQAIVRASHDAGEPRAASSVSRWVHNDRIPDPRTAELVQRRALVARYGGVSEMAAELGTTAATVSQWQSGRINTMRGAPGTALARARAADAAARAGIDLRAPRLYMCADIEHRAYGSTSDQYSGEREIDIDLDADAALEIADALARGDHPAALAITEQAWSNWYTRTYSDGSGVHINHVTDFALTFH